jgi:hypothetical protein
VVLSAQQPEPRRASPLPPPTWEASLGTGVPKGAAWPRPRLGARLLGHPVPTRLPRWALGCTPQKGFYSSYRLTELERQVDTNPKPEETYVMLERLYLRKGRPEKAAEVSASYLREEPGTHEKCERFRRLSPHTLRAVEAPALEAVRKQCSQP